MKSSFLSQLFFITIIFALLGSLNYGQNMRQKDNKFIGSNRISKNIQQNVNSNDLKSTMHSDSKEVTRYIPNGVETVLWDQTAGTTTSGVASQNFETAFDIYDCEAADDFTVPAGGWTVRRVIVGGFYATTGPAAGFNIFIYPDASGAPGASPVYTATAQPYSYDGVAFYSIGLSSPAVLAAGTYWITIQCEMDFGAGGQWYEFTSTDVNGATAQWQNPGGGFASCTSWGAITTCNGTTETDLSFALTDEECPAEPLPIVADFENSVFPPLCWTLAGSIPLWYNNEQVGLSGVSGYGDGSYSILADFYDFASGSEDLITVEIDLGTAANPTLVFDWAYATFVDDPDELDIYYSTDAGATWTILLAMPGGLNGILNPFHLAQTAPYVPADNEWSTMTLPLPAGTNMIKFTGVPAYGNLCWLDNITITDQFFDNFDSYTSGIQLAGQTTDWQTWSGGTGTAEDPFVSSTYSFSPSNSVVIQQDNDLVRVNGPKTSGVWYMSWMTYIPTGKIGYFNTLSDFAGANSEFAMQAFFDPGGVGSIDAGGAASASFFYPYDTWFQVWLKVDLDADLATLRVNGSLVHTWQYTLGTFGDPPIALQLDANDFYGGSADDQMYIDNYYFSAKAPAIQQLAADAGMASIDVDVAIAPGSATPMATVQNFGSATQSFDVTMTIGAYSSTKSVTDLVPDGTVQVTFDSYTAVTGGPYTVEVCTQLTGDLNTANDCLSQDLYVWDPSGTWSSGNVMPAGGTYLGGSCSYVEVTPADANIGHLYSLGGVTNSGTGTGAECYEYNVSTNTWTAITSLPAGRDRNTGAIAGGFVYEIGGYDAVSGIRVPDVYKYDITAGGAWTAVASLPDSIGWGKAVSYMDQYIYHAGGYDGTDYLADVYMYDVNLNTWVAATPMPAGAFGGGFAINGNQLVYIGGAAASGLSDAVYIGTITANPAVINWTVASSKLPEAGNDFSYISADIIANPDMVVRDKYNHSSENVPLPAGGLYRTDAAAWGSDGIIITTGTNSNFVPTIPNYCFVYSLGSDTWSAQTNLPTPVLGSALGSVNDGNDWTLIVAGGSPSSGVSVDNTQLFNNTLGGSNTFALNVNVTDGWNMVSVPGTNPAGMGVTDWWSGKDPAAGVFKYSGGYVAVTTTTPTEGYWMKNLGAQSYSYPAIQIVTHNSINAAAGWNLIGGYENTVPVGNLTTTPPNLINTTIYEYSGGYVPATNITPGYGYWVKMDAAGLIDAPPLAKGSGEVVKYLQDNWGKIIITDAAGRSYTLYAVNGDVDLNKYELPPAPPSGVLDIRYGSGRIAENLSSSQSIDMNGVQYPLSVKVQNMNLTLQDPSGMIVNTTINPGDEVTIRDNTINKLIVNSDGSNLPTEYALEQNYPNPFNPSTTIKFALPEATDVTLNIYNSLGQRVAQLVNSRLEAGRYSYQWDAGNIATGMYIYELRASDFVSVKKMLLLK